MDPVVRDRFLAIARGSQAWRNAIEGSYVLSWRFEARCKRVSEHACNVRGQVKESHDDVSRCFQRLFAPRARPEVVGFPRFARRTMAERSLFSRREGERLVHLENRCSTITGTRSRERLNPRSDRKNETLGLLSLYRRSERFLGSSWTREKRGREEIHVGLHASTRLPRLLSSPSCSYLTS